jgi:uncharacterized membrane protein
LGWPELFCFMVSAPLVGAGAALVAYAIMAVAVPELDHSQEVRMYTKASTVRLASLRALVAWLEDHRILWLAPHSALIYLALLTTTVISGLLLAEIMGALLLCSVGQNRQGL